MCKECGKVYSVLEMKDGVCKKCRGVEDTEEIATFHLAEETSEPTSTSNPLFKTLLFSLIPILSGFFALNIYYSQILDDAKNMDFRSAQRDKDTGVEILKAMDWECFKGDEGMCRTSYMLGGIFLGEEAEKAKWWKIF